MSSYPLYVIALIDFDAFYAQCETVRLGLSPTLTLAVKQWNAAVERANNEVEGIDGEKRDVKKSRKMVDREVVMAGPLHKTLGILVPYQEVVDARAATLLGREDRSP